MFLFFIIIIIIIVIIIIIILVYVPSNIISASMRLVNQLVGETGGTPRKKHIAIWLVSHDIISVTAEVAPLSRVLSPIILLFNQST